MRLQNDIDRAAGAFVQPIDVLRLAGMCGVDPKREPRLLWTLIRILETPLPPSWQKKRDFLAPLSQTDASHSGMDGGERCAGFSGGRQVLIKFYNIMDGRTATQHPATDYLDSEVCLLFCAIDVVWCLAVSATAWLAPASEVSAARGPAITYASAVRHPWVLQLDRVRRRAALLEDRGMDRRDTLGAGDSGGAWIPHQVSGTRRSPCTTWHGCLVPPCGPMC